MVDTELRNQVHLLEERVRILESLVNYLNARIFPPPPGGKIPEWIMRRELARIEAKDQKRPTQGLDPARCSEGETPTDGA